MEHTKIAPNLRKLIRNHGRSFTVRKNQVFQSSDHREVFTLIDTGYIKRYAITNDGSQSIQSIYGPEFMYPLTLVFDKILDQKIYTGRESFYYETMTPSKLITIDLPSLKNLVDDDPMLYREILQVAGRRFHSNIHNLENLSLENVHKRLAHSIAHHAEMFGVETSNGIKIELPLRQQDFASILDVARETVSVNMKVLREKKLIKGTTNLTVVDLEKLLDEAYS
jgi:CRP-like cAMP-binding protein